jgi:hypothetical protein
MSGMRAVLRGLALVGLAALLILVAGAGAVPAAVTQDLGVLLSHPHRFVAGAESVVLSPEQLRALAHAEGDEIVIDSHFARLLTRHFADRAAHDAQLRIGGEHVTVVPGVAARVLDAEATAAVLISETRRESPSGSVPPACA